MYIICKAYEDAKVLCYSVTKHTVDSSYLRTTEECREHLLIASISKFLLYSQITRMKKSGAFSVCLSSYWFGITRNAVGREPLTNNYVSTSFQVFPNFHEKNFIYVFSQ